MPRTAPLAAKCPSKGKCMNNGFWSHNSRDQGKAASTWLDHGA